MAKGQKAGLAKTGSPVSSRMLLFLYFANVENVTIDAAEQQATDRVQWRGLIRYKEQFLCGAGCSKSNDLEDYPSASASKFNLNSKE